MRIQSQLGSALALPLEITVLILGGLWLGNWLDERYGTSPWLVSLLGLAGLGAAGLVVWQLQRRAQADEQDPSKSPPPGPKTPDSD